MSLELWEKRIWKDGQGNPKRFTFFNPNTNGLGTSLEFTGITDSGIGRQLTFRCDLGEGHLWISASDGQVREPFFHRTWFLGQMIRKGQPCMIRFRFIDEASGGPEQGTRVYTQWQPGEWKVQPKQDIQGNIENTDPKYYFGWSVNGNAYHWEPKPVQPAEDKKDVKKTPKTFGGAQPTAVTGESKPEEVKAEEAPVKKPKVFVPKSKPNGEPSPSV
jgi:hypothetical protein